MKEPGVTIVILNFNGLNDTKECLKSLLNTKYDNFKIIIADNGSVINEAKILKNGFKNNKIKIFRFNKNYGFSGGNNKIIKKIKSKYIVLLNNDTTVNPNWLKPLIDFFEKDKSIGVVQPKILWHKDKKYFDYAGACGGFMDKYGYAFTKGRIFEYREKDRGQYDYKSEILWASGACMAIRNEALKKTGLFDPIFFNYMEEIDLCFRMRNAGYKILFQPKSVIFHKVAASASKTAFKKRFWEHRNNLLLIIKNFPAKDLATLFPQRIVMENISIFYYLFKKRFKHALAALLSEFSIIYFLPIILKKRKSANINGNTKNFIYNKSIVFYYFLKNKKSFPKFLKKNK